MLRHGGWPPPKSRSRENVRCSIPSSPLRRLAVRLPIAAASPCLRRRPGQTRSERDREGRNGSNEEQIERAFQIVLKGLGLNLARKNPTLVGRRHWQRIHFSHRGPRARNLRHDASRPRPDRFNRPPPKSQRCLIPQECLQRKSDVPVGRSARAWTDCWLPMKHVTHPGGARQPVWAGWPRAAGHSASRKSEPPPQRCLDPVTSTLEQLLLEPRLGTPERRQEQMLQFEERHAVGAHRDAECGDRRAGAV